jgi:hypothetical protein
MWFVIFLAVRSQFLTVLLRILIYVFVCSRKNLSFRINLLKPSGNFTYNQV